MVKPHDHGNSSRSKSFSCMSEAAKDEVRQLAASHTPPQAISVMTAQHGGEVQVLSHVIRCKLIHLSN